MPQQCTGIVTEYVYAPVHVAMFQIIVKVFIGYWGLILLELKALLADPLASNNKDIDGVASVDIALRRGRERIAYNGERAVERHDRPLVSRDVEVLEADLVVEQRLDQRLRGAVRAIRLALEATNYVKVIHSAAA